MRKKNEEIGNKIEKIAICYDDSTWYTVTGHMDEARKLFDEMCDNTAKYLTDYPKYKK